MSTDKWSPNAEGYNEVILWQIGTTPAVKYSRCVVCVCVYEDTNLYIDMGMTQVLQGEVIYEDMFSVPIIQNVYKSYRISFFEKVQMHKVSCEG